MIRSVQPRTIALLLSLLLLRPLAGLADAAAPPQSATSGAAGQPQAILIGFQGGFFHHRVQHFRDAMAKMHDEYGARTEVVFNGLPDRKEAMRSVDQWLDANGDGKLSDEEKQQARIILLGHSWGGPAMLAFARDLKRQHIPVLLTIQIDSVFKVWPQTDRVVPSNVKEAANFYQRKGFFIFQGRSKIVAADPADTKILGDFEIPYDPASAAMCTDYTKLLRGLNRYHIAIECDPRLWSRVDSLVSTELKRN